MKLFGEGIVHALVGISQHVVEKVEQDEDADHVTDIEVTCKSESQENNKNSVSAVFYHLFNAVGNEGQPHNRIYPHCVILLNYTVSRKRIHHREGDYGKLIFVYRVLVEIKRHCSAADSRLDKEHNEQKFLSPVLWKKTDELNAKNLSEPALKRRKIFPRF